MLCIHLKSTDPYICLATEEYLLKNYNEDIFMLWQSHEAVVVGKHQNAMGEIDYRYIRENGIKVARRISGGGTVFHDRGNVNFTFIKNVSGPQEISFKRFTQPVVDALATLGVNAATSGRNDLLAGGLKISGNAEHVYKNRVLHHGTLLYDSDLDNLGNAIRVVPGKYVSKAVPSNRSKVANISGFIKNPPSVQSFLQFLLGFQLKTNPENRMHTLLPEENDRIKMLADEKFRTYDWIYGYSPGYRFSNSCSWQNKKLEISFQVEKTKIRDIELEGDVYSEEEIIQLKEKIPGSLHAFGSLSGIHDLLGIRYDADLIYGWF